MSIKDLHQQYLAAVKTARDPSLSREARARAEEALVEARRQLDLGLMHDAQEREHVADDDAKQRALAILDGSVPAADSDELREFYRPVDPSRPMQQYISVPLDLRHLEKRVEYPLALGDTTYTFGNYGVGSTVASAMMTGLTGQSAILEAGPKVFRTPTAEPLVVPTATDIVAGYRAEGVTAAEDTVVLSKLTLSGFHLAGYTEVTSEFEGSALNGGGPAFVSELCGRSLGVKLATELAVGTDASDTICGAFTAPTVGVTAVASTSFSAQELRALRQSVPPAARRKGVWVFSDAAMAHALQLIDDNGNFMIQPGINGDGADTLWGQKCLCDPYGPALTASKHVVLYGDFSNAFVVRFVGNLEVTRSDQAGLTEFVSWISVYRYQVTVDSGTSRVTCAR